MPEQNPTTRQHTPVPWRAEKQRFGEVSIYPAKDPHNARGLIARLEYGKIGERHADGDFIITAVNAHDDLRAALETLVLVMQAWRETGKPDLGCLAAAHDDARAAIAKAQG